ncbi:Short-chain dehydrogenase/reductase SDR [Penicillium chermesinum]|uniref:Short-chain dehydrogenase/reductase SDR n=1 Tax=Penicillium chermesinum TaxID=63820 RepID=A0A9W9NIM6_9EURO|nr:Short-chain dehydrogenase/reductase SDR [Penicillium chermesinum]KAJ5220511.1 Short-chain dehydrogenase/reductase SDR [Penicillium chermesinum]
MSQYIPQITSHSLADKVVLITGGANGIGASLVQDCLEKGANVCFGDLDNVEGERLLNKTRERFPPVENGPARVVFQPTDVTNYQSVLSLFDLAFETYKRIDHVVSAAGIVEIGNWFDFGLTLDSVRETPTSKVLDVNLLGTMYVARIASVYLRHNRGPGTDRSILLFSCVSGFKESPSLFVYQASKHGVLGLMRSLRSYISSPYKHCIRINTIAPWITETDSVKKIQHKWKEASLPTNTPQEVSHIAAGMLADRSLNGKSMFVEGGRAWETEENVERLESHWLGEEPSKALAAGQEFLDDGSIWTAKPRQRSSISKQNGIFNGPKKSFSKGDFTPVANGVH